MSLTINSLGNNARIFNEYNLHKFIFFCNKLSVNTAAILWGSFGLVDHDPWVQFPLGPPIRKCIYILIHFGWKLLPKGLYYYYYYYYYYTIIVLLALYYNYNITYHIDKLCYGESELDDDHVWDVGYGSGPLVVPDEELFEKLVLRMWMGFLKTENYRGHKRHGAHSFITNLLLYPRHQIKLYLSHVPNTTGVVDLTVKCWILQV